MCVGGELFNVCRVPHRCKGQVALWRAQDGRFNNLAHPLRDAAEKTHCARVINVNN
jgi:hypothetical protein